MYALAVIRRSQHMASLVLHHSQLEALFCKPIHFCWRNRNRAIRCFWRIYYFLFLHPRSTHCQQCHCSWANAGKFRTHSIVWNARHLDPCRYWRHDSCESLQSKCTNVCPWPPSRTRRRCGLRLQPPPAPAHSAEQGCRQRLRRPVHLSCAALVPPRLFSPPPPLGICSPSKEVGGAVGQISRVGRPWLVTRSGWPEAQSHGTAPGHGP